MAYNINDVYNFLTFIVRKERGVFITIPEAMQTLDNAQLEATEDWFTGYGATQILHDAIRKLRTALGTICRAILISSGSRAVLVPCLKIPEPTSAFSRTLNISSPNMSFVILTYLLLFIIQPFYK